MSLHYDKKKKKKKRNAMEADDEFDDEEDLSLPLATRLRTGGSEIDPIPPALLRKYIAYARKYSSPKLTPEAARILQRFYLILRSKHKTVDGTPITTRQLESLIRLSEARAKVELREEVTERDAQDVVEIMKESLFDMLEDEHGHIDFRRTTGMSKRNLVKRFISELTRRAELDYNWIFTYQQLCKIGQEIGCGLDLRAFRDFIDNLNQKGYFTKQGVRTYKLLQS